MSEDDWDDEAGDAEEEPTLPCPQCRREIHEESQRCPYCGHYLTEEEAGSRRKPWWIILGVILALYVVYRWVAG